MPILQAHTIWYTWSRFRKMSSTICWCRWRCLEPFALMHIWVGVFWVIALCPSYGTSSMHVTDNSIARRWLGELEQYVHLMMLLRRSNGMPSFLMESFAVIIAEWAVERRNKSCGSPFRPAEQRSFLVHSRAHSSGGYRGTWLLFIQCPIWISALHWRA